MASALEEASESFTFAKLRRRIEYALLTFSWICIQKSHRKSIPNKLAILFCIYGSPAAPLAKPAILFCCGCLDLPLSSFFSPPNLQGGLTSSANSTCSSVTQIHKYKISLK